MALSTDEVRKVAVLSRLELSEAELQSQAAHLNRLLERFAALQEIDVTGVEPTAHNIPVYNVMRDDVARPSLPRDEALANAPEARDGCFIVPRILEG